MKKSKTQMTKAELIELLKQKEEEIRSLKADLDNINKDRIEVDTIVTDKDTSFIIASLNSRVKKLEEKLAIKEEQERKRYLCMAR